MWFLGMDVGTGGTRAVVVDADGRLISGASSEHAAFRTPHPGWAEQDPEDWWRAAQEAITLALMAAPEPHEPIAAIGLTGQMHGAVMLDESGAVLRPSLIWCDTRTQPECDWLTEKIGYERLIELTCNPALPNFTLTKLLWVKTHEPEIFAKIRHIMCPKDYVRYRLTGEFAIDVQEASGTLLLDVTHRRWSKEVAEAAGIPESWLPKVYESPEVCARISETAAGLTGLKAGTPVVAGAGDQGAGAVGMGILQPGSVSATIGTSGVVFAATANPTKDPKGRLHTFCHAVPGLWHVMGVTQSAGLSLHWLKETFFAGQNYDAHDGGGGEGSRGQRRADVGAVSAGRADAASRSGGAGGVCRDFDDPHGRAFYACGAGGRGLFAARHVHAVCGPGNSGERGSAGRRRRARSAVAQDSGWRLRAGGRDADGGRRRSIWLRADGGSGRGALGESGRGVRASH